MTLDAYLPWIIFSIVVVVILALDLGVFNRKPHAVGTREALLWSLVWIITALVFNLGVLLWEGPEKGLQFLTGYLIEKSLSVDNIFVFLLILSYFGVPALYHHKVLFWGILGAVVTRGLFIFAGITLIVRFHWVIFVFGGFLILTAVRMARRPDEEIHPERNPVLRLFRRFVKVTAGYEDGKFFVRKNGRFLATPLLVVLLVIETTDIVFAIDSIPAVLAITLDPFIVYTSNMFAILGLRALSIALVGVSQRFFYLRYGLSAILAFVGGKMVLGDIYTIPVAAALGVIGTVLLVSVAASILHPREEPASRVSQTSDQTDSEKPVSQSCSQYGKTGE